MRGISLDSTKNVVHEDAESWLQHQSLKQDYQELQKETEAIKIKLEATKQRKATLLAEVRFLRRRDKYLSRNKFKILKPKNLRKQLVNNTKKTLQGVERVSSQNPTWKINFSKETAFKKPMIATHSNQNTRIYGENGGMGSIFESNHTERARSGKDGKDAAVSNRAPVFDLNVISEEAEEFENRFEPLDFEAMKKGLIGGGSGEPNDDLRVSVCRNLGTNLGVGDGSTGVVKRKISWQEPVAVRV